MSKLAIKVCGIKNFALLPSLTKLPLTYLGFIAAPRSPRSILEVQRETVSEALAAIPSPIKPTLVTRDLDPEIVFSLLEQLPFKAIQLHGGESIELCKKLREDFPTLQIIKALSISGTFPDQAVHEFSPHVDFLLFDRASAQGGGSGEKFEWELLAELKVPSFIAGGIGPDDGAALLSLLKKVPTIVGLDLNSRFEKAPGEKDISLLQQLFLSLAQGGVL